MILVINLVYLNYISNTLKCINLVITLVYLNYIYNTLKYITFWPGRIRKQNDMTWSDDLCAVCAGNNLSLSHWLQMSSNFVRAFEEAVLTEQAPCFHLSSLCAKLSKAAAGGFIFTIQTLKYWFSHLSLGENKYKLYISLPIHFLSIFQNISLSDLYYFSGIRLYVCFYIYKGHWYCSIGTVGMYPHILGNVFVPSCVMKYGSE